MVSINSPKRQNKDAELFWQNVLQLRRDCLNNQSRRPVSYEELKIIAQKAKEKAATESKWPVEPPH